MTDAPYQHRRDEELSVPFNEAWEHIRQHGIIHEPETVYTEEGGFHVASAHVYGAARGYAQLVGRWSGDEHAPQAASVTLQARVMPEETEALKAYLSTLPFRRAVPDQP